MTKQELIKAIEKIKGKSTLDLNQYTEAQLEFHLSKLEAKAYDRPNRTGLGDFMRGIRTPVTVRPIAHKEAEERVETVRREEKKPAGVALSGFDALNQNKGK